VAGIVKEVTVGVNFSGPGGLFQLTWRGWGYMLDLAAAHGWQPPAEVAHEEGPDGTMGFWIDDLHQFTSAEAAALAGALEKALDDIPDHEVIRDKQLGGDRGIPGDRIGEVSAVEWFGGNKQLVRDFIAFCKAGEFTVGKSERRRRA
jgi:hypothetical protein